MGVKVPFKVGVGVEDEVNHFYTRWVLDITKLILNSIQIEEVVEVRVELGKKNCLSWRFIFFVVQQRG